VLGARLNESNDIELQQAASSACRAHNKISLSKRWMRSFSLTNAGDRVKPPKWWLARLYGAVREGQYLPWLTGLQSDQDLSGQCLSCRYSLTLWLHDVNGDISLNNIVIPWDAVIESD
jgi:hypothetical protein